MKASPTPGKYFPKVLFGLLIAGSPLVSAQDSLTLQNGQRRDGKITGVTGGNVQIQTAAPAGQGTVTGSVPLTQVTAASIVAPREYQTALAAWEDGNAANFLSAARPLAEKFRGLPVSWVERLTALLPAAYLKNNQIPEAEKALAELEAAYPGETTIVTISKAQIALAKQNLAEVKTLLQPIAEESTRTRLAESAQSAAFGQAFYLLGQVYEAEGNLPEALNAYLKTTTLFYEDKASVTQAQKRADELTKTQKVIVP